jgi:hypothetical protein
MRRLTALSLCLLFAGIGIAMSPTPVAAAPASDAGDSKFETITARRDALAHLTLNFRTLAKQAPPAGFSVAQRNDWHAQSKWLTSVTQRIDASVVAHNEVLAQLRAGKLSQGKAKRRIKKLELSFESLMFEFYREADARFSDVQCTVVGTCSRGDATRRGLAAIPGAPAPE